MIRVVRNDYGYEIGGFYCSFGRNKKYVQNFGRRIWRKRPLGGPRNSLRLIILKCTLKKYGVRVRAGIIWFNWCPSVDELSASIRNGKFDNVNGFTGMPRLVLLLGQLGFIHPTSNCTAASVVRTPFVNIFLYFGTEDPPFHEGW